MQKITPNLWYDTQAEDAANFYISVFKEGKILSISHYPEGTPDVGGQVLAVDFELRGQRFVGINGGPVFKFTEAVSFSIDCEDQEEIDYFWNSLTADGGEESECGWLKDKYGLSWQVVPAKMGELMTGPNADKVSQALFQMKKIDLATLEEAAKS